MDGAKVKMPSNSLHQWNDKRVPELDEIANAHAQVGGSDRGRRYATQQINHAYAMLLTSQFQGYCRDLHSEAVDHISRAVLPIPFRDLLRAEFNLHRELDRGNPTRGNIGADFNRIGLEFWGQVRIRSKRNNARIAHLDDLCLWRNAIAHQDFDAQQLTGTLNLKRVGQWRQACDKLAKTFDEVIGEHISQTTGVQPW